MDAVTKLSHFEQQGTVTRELKPVLREHYGTVNDAVQELFAQGNLQLEHVVRVGQPGAAAAGAGVGEMSGAGKGVAAGTAAAAAGNAGGSSRGMLGEAADAEEEAGPCSTHLSCSR
jgi:hypothetical protein